jgi:hypothetical protein
MTDVVMICVFGALWLITCGLLWRSASACSYDERDRRTGTD